MDEIFPFESILLRVGHISTAGRELFNYFPPNLNNGRKLIESTRMFFHHCLPISNVRCCKIGHLLTVKFLNQNISNLPLTATEKTRFHETFKIGVVL